MKRTGHSSSTPSAWYPIALARVPIHNTGSARWNWLAKADFLGKVVQAGQGRARADGRGIPELCPLMMGGAGSDIALLRVSNLALLEAVLVLPLLLPWLLVEESRSGDHVGCREDGGGGLQKGLQIQG